MKDVTIAECILQGQEKLASCSDSAKLDAQIIVAYLLNKETSYLLTWPEKTLSEQAFSQFQLLLNRRIKGEPIAYIVGTKEFWSLPFKVSPATLIPRPDTEVLVELVLEHHADKKQLQCLDLGTGTGAIALALASEKALWNISAVDFSVDAVNLAKQNATNLNLSHVNIFHSDWFSAVEDKKFNVIVSNPPYIDALDENLSQGDVRFEPESALVAKEHGLADIRHIAQESLNYLTSDGVLYFEHGFEQAASVREILMSLGYQGARTQKDFNGHDRITWAYYSPKS